MMNTVKRFAALVLALGFLAGLCGAAAETAGTEEYTGVWYLTTVRIDGEEYDVSHSAERRIVEFGEGNTGRIINSYDKEEKQFSWTAEENGLRTCAVTDSENRTELVPMVIAENRLVLMYVDGGYIFTREEGERADIRYGMAAEFSVAPGSEEMADGIAAVMRQRLEEQGCADATAERSGTGGIRVEIPDTQDVELIDLISATGELRFLDPDDEVILTRDQVESAEYYNQYGTPGVCIRMTEEGTKLFAEATAANIGNNIRIMLDDKMLVDATVRDAITDGTAIVSGYTVADAQALASKIRSGPLPAAVTLEKLVMVTDPEHARTMAAAAKAEREDAAVVALKLGDTEITRGEVREAVEERLNELVTMYALFNQPLDPDDPQVLARTREEVVHRLKRDMVFEIKAAELGLDRLTEEEAAEAEEHAQMLWNDNVYYVYEYLLTEDEQQQEDDEREKLIHEILDGYGVSMEEYRKETTKEVLDGKMRDYIVRDVTVSEDEVREEYENRKASGADEAELSEEGIRAQLLDAKQEEIYDATVEEWIASAGIEENLGWTGN